MTRPWHWDVERQHHDLADLVVVAVRAHTRAAHLQIKPRLRLNLNHSMVITAIFVSPGHTHNETNDWLLLTS